MKITSHRLFYPLLLALIIFGVYSYTFDAKVAQLGDNASYFMLGKALSAGEGYVNISKITKTPNNHYPPGFPAFLGLGMMLGLGITGLKILNGLALIIAAGILYILSEKLTGSRVLAFCATLLTILNYHILQYGSMLMSETLFMCLSLLALWFAANTQKIKDHNFILAVAFGIFAYYTRSLGLALIVAITVYYFSQKKWREATIYFAAFVAAALPWFVRSQRLGGGSYTRQLQMINPYRPELGNANLTDYFTRIWENFSRYISKEIPYSLFPGDMPNYQEPATLGSWLLGIFLVAAVIYGALRLEKYRLLILGYLFFTFGILMLWPDVWVGPRFMLPLIPVMYLGLLQGLTSLFTLLLSQANKSFQPGWLAALAIFLIPSVNVLHDQAKTPLHPAWQNYYAVATWLSRNEKPDVVVSCGKPALFHLYSGTFTSRYAFDNNPETLISELEKAQVDYVVLDQVYPNTIRYLLPAIQTYPERFQQVHSLKNPETYLFKFVK
jgi:hypothetical protein